MGNQIKKTTYSNNAYDCAVVSNQGERRYMEDRNVVCLSLPNHSDYALFGIFDGFNGDYASTYLAQNLLTELDTLHNLDDDNLIISTLHSMDRNWMKSEFKQENHDTNAGSTVVFALVKQNKNEHIIRVFWAGDSRAMAMVQNEEHIFENHNLTIDHHCDLEGEIKRIKNANGKILEDRVDGKVAITRCFGCQIMKNNMDLPQTEQKMVSTLECKHFVCQTNDILLLFCDGLIAANWSNERLASKYKHNYRQHRDEKDGLLNCLIYLADEAIDDGSKDNITVISVQFKNNTGIAQNVSNVYRPSLSTGIYGCYVYPVYGNQNITKRKKQFVIKYAYDEQKMVENELTDVEKENVRKFGKLLSSKHHLLSDWNYTQSDLVRYIIGCKNKLSVAEHRFLNFKQLEMDYKLNEVKLCDVKTELEKECYMLCGYDWNNNAIVGFKMNKFIKKDMNISVMIRSIHCLIDAITSDINILRNGVVILFDMKGIKKDNMATHLETIFIQSFQNCYPLRIKQFIIVDAPIIVRAALKIAKLMLSKKLSERIISVKSDQNGGLWKLVGQQAVPKCVHGKFNSSAKNAWQYMCSKSIDNIADMLEEKQAISQ